MHRDPIMPGRYFIFDKVYTVKLHKIQKHINYERCHLGNQHSFIYYLVIWILHSWVDFCIIILYSSTNMKIDNNNIYSQSKFNKKKKNKLAYFQNNKIRWLLEKNKNELLNILSMYKIIPYSQLDLNEVVLNIKMKYAWLKLCLTTM